MGEKVEDVIDALKRQLPAAKSLYFPTKVRFPRHPFSRLGQYPDLETLDLTGARVKSLLSLPPQPCLRRIVADSSQIETLEGVGAQPRLASLSLIGAPVSQFPHFRLAAMIANPMISVVNGAKVTLDERRMSEAYPPVARQLVNAGWVMQCPPPSSDDFQVLAQAFGARAADADFALPPAASVRAPLPGEPPGGRQPRFAQRMAALLSPLGFPIWSGPEMRNDVLLAVTQMCDIVELMEKAEQASELTVVHCRRAFQTHLKSSRQSGGFDGASQIFSKSSECNRGRPVSQFVSKGEAIGETGAELGKGRSQIGAQRAKRTRLLAVATGIEDIEKI
jgi:hypothetical protein